MNDATTNTTPTSSRTEDSLAFADYLLMRAKKYLLARDENAKPDPDLLSDLRVGAFVLNSVQRAYYRSERSSNPRPFVPHTPNKRKPDTDERDLAAAESERARLDRVLALMPPPKRPSAGAQEPPKEPV